MCFSYNQACLLCYTLSIKLSSSFFGHYNIKKGKIKETNGFNRGNKLNTSTSTQNTRIDRIFFDSGEDLCRVTNKRKGVCRQW